MAPLRLAPLLAALLSLVGCAAGGEPPTPPRRSECLPLSPAQVHQQTRPSP